MFSYIMVRTSYILMRWWWHDDEVHFVLDQHAELDFYSASSLKQQSAGRHVAPLVHIILIPSQPVFPFTSLCCVLCGEATNTNFSLWCDLTGAQTHDLQHSRQARYPLHHWCSSKLGWRTEDSSMNNYYPHIIGSILRL